MDDSSLLEILTMAFGGIGVFLLGMRLLSNGLQTLAGERLNRWISAVTDNRLLAVLAGVGVTCLVQSSTATTVMVVGFVNAGIMTLVQGISVVFGAHVGTTLSLWLLTLNVAQYGGLVVGTAVFFYLFSKNERVRYFGMAFMGLGMLFFGLQLLAEGFEPLREMESVRNALAFFAATSTAGFLKAALVSAVVTALIHSSAAVVVLVMGLAGAGVVDFYTAVALVLGSNIGTTFTALIACIGASRNAIRAALANTLSNVLGVVLITFVWHPFADLCAWIIGHFRAAPEAGAGPEAMRAYYTFATACVHTIFNVAATIILFPFIGLFARIVTLLVPVRESERAREGFKARYLDPNLVSQPALALAQAQKEILRMGETCLAMFADLRAVLAAPEDADEDEALEERVFQAEKDLDLAQKEISEYVGRAMHGALSPFQADLARREIRQADEFESVSDYVRNALKAYKKIRNAGERLTPVAVGEVLDLCDRIAAFARDVMDIVQIGDRFNVPRAIEAARAFEAKAKEYRDAHMRRIGVSCTAPVKSLVYSDLLVAFRRQNDHLLNIAQTLEG